MAISMSLCHQTDPSALTNSFVIGKEALFSCECDTADRGRIMCCVLGCLMGLYQ